MSVLDRLWLHRGVKPLVPPEKPPPDTWTCIACGRTYPNGGPRFVDIDLPADAPDLCIDCSH